MGIYKFLDDCVTDKDVGINTLATSVRCVYHSMAALPSAVGLVMSTLLHLGECGDFCFTGKCPFMYS